MMAGMEAIPTAILLRVRSTFGSGTVFLSTDGNIGLVNKRGYCGIVTGDRQDKEVVMNHSVGLVFLDIDQVFFV